MANPTIGPFSPTAGAELTRFGTITFDVTDDGLELCAVTVKFPTQRVWETVHDGAAFAPGYLSSTRTVISGGFRYVLRRTEGWVERPSVYVRAYDTSDQDTVITIPISGEIDDDESLLVTAADPNGLQPVTIIAKYPTHWDTVYDGVSFNPFYSRSEIDTDVEVEGGTAYRLRRTGGWDEDFTLEVIAYGTLQPIDTILGLRAHYEATAQASGSILDQSGLGHHMSTLSGAAAYGSSIDLENAEYVECPALDLGASYAGFTLVAVINIGGMVSGARMIRYFPAGSASENRTPMLSVQGAQFYAFGADNDNNGPGHRYTAQGDLTGEWHLVICTLDEKGTTGNFVAKLYVDGDLATAPSAPTGVTYATTPSNTAIPQSAPFRIGQGSGTTDISFKWARVYNRELSPADRAIIYDYVTTNNPEVTMVGSD